ncbi:MAG: hypothetical protein NC033_05350 [Clostridiales bacterium]|nr:hypothetical protein [Clostridiales bacterium]
MTMLWWRILCLISAVLFIAGVIVLLCTNLTKNKYYHNYHEDELLKKERSVNSINSIYLTSGETRRFIKKYVVCKSAYEKYLVCNFTETFRHIRFYVVQFSRRKRVLSVLEVTQRDLTDVSSRIIALKRSCARVNVVIAEADGTVINQNYVRPISMQRLRVYACLKSAVIFAALFVLRHVIVEIMGGSLIYGRNVAYQYLNNSLNYIAIGASFVLAVLGYFVTVLSFRRKNAKAMNGGALEYEFV